LYYLWLLEDCQCALLESGSESTHFRGHHRIQRQKLGLGRSGRVPIHPTVTLAVTPKERVLAKSVRTASDVLSVHADARPSGCCCCRHGRPPLMMLAWSIGPRSVAIQTTRSCTKSCSSCLHASPLTSCSAGCRASLQVWHPHEAIEALACGTFSSIVWLAYMLVDQPCKSAW
jgi:hypothetical protein